MDRKHQTQLPPNCPSQVYSQVVIPAYDGQQRGHSITLNLSARLPVKPSAFDTVSAELNMAKSAATKVAETAIANIADTASETTDDSAAAADLFSNVRVSAVIGNVAMSLEQAFCRVVQIMASLKTQWQYLLDIDYRLRCDYPRFIVKDARSASVAFAIALMNIDNSVHSREQNHHIVGTGLLRVDGSIEESHLESVKQSVFINQNQLPQLDSGIVVNSGHDVISGQRARTYTSIAQSKIAVNHFRGRVSAGGSTDKAADTDNENSIQFITSGDCQHLFQLQQIMLPGY